MLGGQHLPFGFSVYLDVFEFNQQFKKNSHKKKIIALLLLPPQTIVVVCRSYCNIDIYDFDLFEENLYFLVLE